MSKIQIIATIDPPDIEHCLNPKTSRKRKTEHCKFMNWMPCSGGLEYSCDVYRKRLRKRKDGTIIRPRWCRNREVSK